MSMRLDHYHDEDAEAVAELLAAVEELPSTSAAAFRSFAAQSYNRGARDFRVLRTDSQLLALLTSTLLLEGPTPIRHFRILVHPGHRQQGLATRLMDALAQQDVPANCLLQANSQRSWQAGNAFLEGHGFGVTQREQLMCLESRSALAGSPTTDAMSIRPARPSDDLAWMRLHRLAYQEREDFSALLPADLVSERACPGFALFVAESQGEVVGYVHVLHLDPREGLVNSLVVHERAQGKGLGFLLLQHALGKLWHEGVAKISLNVSSENSRAIRVYEKAGFRSYDEMLRYQCSLDAWVR